MPRRSASRTSKEIKCPYCGNWYGRRRVRCPHCRERNVAAEDEWLSPLSGMPVQDRLFGLVLMALGFLFGGLLLWVLLATSFLGGGRLAILGIVPVGLVLTGTLFLLGIHPKDLKNRMDAMSPLGQVLLKGVGFLAGLGVAALMVYLFFF
jgi:hypothetical protein